MKGHNSHVSPSASVFFFVMHNTSHSINESGVVIFTIFFGRVARKKKETK
jgi:hypothetical protein